MAFNIEAFKANGLIGGGARPSLFEVRMTALPTSIAAVQEKVTFLAATASLPSSELDLVEIPYFGRRIRIAGERLFKDWTITIMNDEDFKLRDMFESWSNKINAHVSNRQDSPPGDLLDYKVDSVEVLQYGKTGPGVDSGVIRSYQFFGMFPLRVEQIPLDWGRGNTIETFDVTFMYDYWVPTAVGLSSPSYSGLIPPDTGAGV